MRQTRKPHERSTTNKKKERYEWQTTENLTLNLIGFLYELEKG